MRVSLRQLIQAALKKEIESRQFYLTAKAGAQDAAAARLLSDLARQEARHAALLKGAGVKRFLAARPEPLDDLRITEFLAARPLSAKAAFQDVLIYAMKREDSSFWVYQAMAESANDESSRKLFRRLAEEERSHRNKLERLYDDVIFNED